MKNGKPHRVPVPSLSVLEKAKPLRNESGLIFPSLMRSRQPMTSLTSRTLVNALEQISLADKTVVHGFRTSFRTWASL